jgi:hypothetical protein
MQETTHSTAPGQTKYLVAEHRVYRPREHKSTSTIAVAKHY